MASNIKILVVDKEAEPAMKLIGQLGSGTADIVFIQQTDRAINNIRNNAYHLIILGDRLKGGGDTYDVGLEIKRSNQNKHTPVICIARNTTKLGKIVMLLHPYSHRLDVSNEEELKATAGLITKHLQSLSKAA